MYSSFQLALKYFKYWLTASNAKGHGVHSPFVYDFIKNVLNDWRQFDCFRYIESLRSELKKNNTEDQKSVQLKLFPIILLPEFFHVGSIKYTVEFLRLWEEKYWQNSHTLLHKKCWKFWAHTPLAQSIFSILRRDLYGQKK